MLDFDTFVRLLTIYNKENKRLDFFDPFPAQEYMMDTLKNQDLITVEIPSCLAFKTIILS
jgi:hypothetical protein